MILTTTDEVSAMNLYFENRSDLSYIVKYLDENTKFTKKVKQAANILDIQLLDHIVIGNGCYTSIFSEERIVNN